MDHKFLVDFGEDLPQWLADDPRLWVNGVGRHPTTRCWTRWLISLLFGLQKLKHAPGTLVAIAKLVMGRYAHIRLRFEAINVKRELG